MDIAVEKIWLSETESLSFANFIEDNYQNNSN